MATNIREAKTHFSKPLERAIQDEDVVFAKAGVPVAVLVGIDRYKPKRNLGFATGVFEMSSLEDFNAPFDFPSSWTQTFSFGR